jgi:hypothetical protein
MAHTQIKSVADFINTEKRSHDNAVYAEKIHQDLMLEMKDNRTFVYEGTSKNTLSEPLQRRYGWSHTQAPTIQNYLNCYFLTTLLYS